MLRKTDDLNMGSIMKIKIPNSTQKAYNMSIQERNNALEKNEKCENNEISQLAMLGYSEYLNSLKKEKAMKRSQLFDKLGGIFCVVFGIIMVASIVFYAIYSSN